FVSCVTAQIHTIDSPAQVQDMAVPEVNLPRLEAALLHAETDFHRSRLELVLRRPLHQDRNELLQTLDQRARHEPPVRSACEEALAKTLLQLRSNLADQRAGLRRRNCAPRLALALQAPMKLHQ